MNWFELIGVIFGLVCVWLTAKQNIWNWPIGIVNVVAFTIMFYNAKLYPDMVLHIIYLWLSIYGWAKWSLGSIGWSKPAQQLPVTNISAQELGMWVTVLPFASVVIGWLFANYTQAASPYIDSTITAISLVAQYLLARKVLQTWCFWIVVDVLAIGLYAYKGLYLSSGLYFLYLLICIKGYTEWQKELQD